MREAIMSKTIKGTINFSQVQSKIIILRNQRVILDSAVAELYGVETMRVNEAVKNNLDKFPAGYVFQLTKEEKQEVIENFDNLPSVKFSPAPPKAFTEKGLYMLATILKSAQATKTTIAIVETFAKIRELSRTVAELPNVPKSKQKELMQKSGEIFADILDDGLQVSDTETSFEIDLAVMKFKHIVRRKEKNKPNTNED
jgi:predicted XRE-type DNA-binding protein